MAKKNFKNSPALQFISEADTEQQQAEQQAYSLQAASDAKAPEGYKLNPLYIEVRNKRVQLVLQPSLYEKIKAKATEQQLSFNEYCHRVLAESVKEE